MQMRLASPWNTKKYSVNNSSTNRTLQAELGIFPSKRGSQGNMVSPFGREKNVKAGTFAFGS